MGILNYFKDAAIGYRLFWISMKLSHEVTDVMGVLNVQKLTSWSDLMGILNIYEVTSLVFWITKWRYGNIQKLTSWVFWNSYSKFKITRLLWIFKIPMSSLQEYSWSDVIGITSAFKYSLWIFKIPMTSLRENSKCLIWIFESCRHGYFVNSWSDVIGLLNTHEVTSWLFMKWPHG